MKYEQVLRQPNPQQQVAGIRGEGFADAVRRTGTGGAVAGSSDAEAIRLALAVHAEPVAATARGYRDAAAGHATTALAAATAAAASADSVALTDNLYPTVAAGLAAVDEGGFFAVAGTGDVYASVYKDVGGVAVLQATYPSRAALDGIGRVVAINNATDNAVAINAALNDPLVRVVYLPAGNISVQSTILVPSGKRLKGAGRGATTITRINNVVDAAQALIKTVDGAVGVRISDFTLVSPKTVHKVQGVWMRGAKDFAVERVDAYNMGYAFWAQELAAFGVFRDCRTFNAQVHCETTQATDILFENIISGDGDGDNPGGVEAVWHPLFGSKRITFRHCRHIGKGSPFYVVADSGAGDAGLIDDILFDDCHAVNTDGKSVLYVSRITGTANIGKIKLRGCTARGGNPPGGDTSIMAFLDIGEVTLENCDFTGFSAENTVVGVNAKLNVYQSRFKVTGASGASGAVFGGSGPIRVYGSVAETATADVELAFGPDVYVSPDTRFISPKTFGGLSSKGRKASHAYPAMSHAEGYEAFGTGVAGQPQATFSTISGATYRMQMRGRIQKTTAGGSIYVAATPFAFGVAATGGITLQDSTGALATSYTGQIQKTAAVGDIRQFEIDLTFVGDGNDVAAGFGAGGATLLAGAEFSVERLS